MGEEFDVKEGHHFDFFVIGQSRTKEVEEALMKQGFLISRASARTAMTSAIRPTS